MPLRRRPTQRLTVPDRELYLTPLFSNVPESLALLEHPTEFGLLDGESIQTLEEAKRLTRQVMRTHNRVTLPVFGSGGVATEAAVANLLEQPADVLVVDSGRDGRRIADYADQYGHRVHMEPVEPEAGLDLDLLRERLRRRRFALVAAVHGEASTGACLEVAELAGIVHEESDALLLLDAASTLAGQAVLVDAWGVDACVAGVQRCLNCPPGLALLSLSDRAVQAFRERSRPVATDAPALDDILHASGHNRAYHHSVPATTIFSLHAALSLVLSEGLENRWRRHADVAAYLVERLTAAGCRPLLPPGRRLHTITAVAPPEGNYEARLRRDLLEMYRVEIGCEWETVPEPRWLIATMGINATRPIVDHLAACIEEVARSAAEDRAPPGSK